MKSIYRPNSKIASILPKQEFEKNREYRITKYLSVTKIPEGYALLNTLSYELIFLTASEYKAFNELKADEDSKRYFVEHYYYVPNAMDETALANQVFSVAELLEKTYKRKKLSFFVVLTTTGCNARCFYCFEKGAKISNMTPKTAEDVADFIIKNAAKHITIQWFGGEPLINTKPIDIVSEKLIDANIDFKATMVSNGYLFDAEMVKKAVKLWKLDKIQITLDGTEEVYNRIKNYVYNDNNSPYRRVLSNIERLLKADVRVSVRLNLDEHNADDLYNLAEELVRKFGKYPNCYIYPCPLFDCSVCGGANKQERDKAAVIEKTMKLRNFIDDNMPKPMIESLPKEFKIPSCMANSDTATMIVSDGHLGKCEHFVDRDFYGSIYSDDYDQQKIIGYKERAIVSEDCKKCKYFLQCWHLKCCTGAKPSCGDIDKVALENRLSSKIRNICNAFFEKEKEQ
ncbi:MAG: radical SAM protein [Eubacterium sp.]|nr:radical SAM protein [Eubacterium sp.]